jgi:hypothetical protein
VRSRAIWSSLRAFELAVVPFTRWSLLLGPASTAVLAKFSIRILWGEEARAPRAPADLRRDDERQKRAARNLVQSLTFGAPGVGGGTPRTTRAQRSRAQRTRAAFRAGVPPSLPASASLPPCLRAGNRSAGDLLNISPRRGIPKILPLFDQGNFGLGELLSTCLP